MIDDPTTPSGSTSSTPTCNGMYLVTKAVLRHMPESSRRPGDQYLIGAGKIWRPRLHGLLHDQTRHDRLHARPGFGSRRAAASPSIPFAPVGSTPKWQPSGSTKPRRSKASRRKQFKAQAIAAVPIRRFFEADEIAELVCYIASDAASGITGQAINICGGQTMV